MSTIRVPGIRLVRACTFAGQFLLFSCVVSAATPQKPVAKAETRPIPQLPAQIELLESKYHFETNGDSRKEVYARVKINNELGVQQFAHLKFNYDRSFQSVEIPLVRIIHPGGGTAETLPSAIADDPDPAVVDFPAYQDVRVKSVRVLGLGPGDLLEYRVITQTTHAPLAPDFWLEHIFDRSDVVSREIFLLDAPAPRVRISINPDTPAAIEKSGQGDSARVSYRWEIDSAKLKPKKTDEEPDIALTTYQNWGALGDRLANVLEPSHEGARSVSAKAQEITHAARHDVQKLQALYNFVAQKIATVDLPLDATGFRTRQPAEILASGYATAEDKFALMSAFASAVGMESRAAFFGAAPKISRQPPVPAMLINCAILVHIPLPPKDLGHRPGRVCDHCGIDYWLLPSMEVAPFSALPATLRGKEAFIPHFMFDISPFADAPKELPFSSTQRVDVDAALGSDGKLTAKVHYSMRGDNELLLRVAFHRNPKDKWKDLAQLLALSDGFRGRVTSVEASDPYATTEPFRVEYEVTQPNFVNWAKKPVRIPAILPLVGLPDPPSPSSTAPADLGTPLDITLHCTLKLPPDTSARIPAGTSVTRDYAEFSSNYSAKGGSLTASRHMRFLLPILPAGRAADYNAFVHAVQNDEAQDFTLERPAAPPPNTHQPSATPKP